MTKSNARLIMAARERTAQLAARANGEKAPMTLGALRTTVSLLLGELELGAASHRRSSAYSDYVAMEIACFVDEAVVEKIQTYFQTLCERHGWEVCRITSHRNNNSVHITLQKSDVISTSDQRMAL
jgi:hypothetical protein